MNSFIKLKPANFVVVSRRSTDKRMANVRTLSEWIEALFSGSDFEQDAWDTIERSIAAVHGDIGGNEDFDSFAVRKNLQPADVCWYFNQAQKCVLMKEAEWLKAQQRLASLRVATNTEGSIRSVALHAME